MLHHARQHYKGRLISVPFRLNLCLYNREREDNITGWERTGQMLCIVDTSLSVLMTLRMCLRELCCLFTVWI